jgi:bifunctional UDP-N-acetylglucosamine pyrophosphorylase / glucosamine-1-phosphate N-acetyltransferase
MSSAADSFQAVILAAGRGTRMKSELPKVLHPLVGKPVISHIVSLLARMGIPCPVVVIGGSGDMVKDALGDCCVYAVQEEQLGSGHAVISAREAVGDVRNVLVICGDSPLFKDQTVRDLMQSHVREGATITLVSAVLEDPTGYGRIIRAPDGEVAGIVEEKLASEEQKAIREINGGLYAFDGPWLWENTHLMRKNDAGEYCLTEMVDIAISQGRRVIAVPASPEEVGGINTPDQLRAAERILLSRKEANL